MARAPEASQELLSRVQAGDKEALAELFSVYREHLRCMIELRMDKRLNGRVSCSDIIQETYIDAFKRIEHYAKKPDMPFYLWLRLVATQRLVDIHRQHFGAEMRNVQREVAMNGHAMADASSVCIAAQFAASIDSPSQAAIKNETLKLLEQALDSMESLDREVLVLRHFEEFTNDEVAHMLGIKKAAASNRYVRALMRLKEVLSRNPGFSGYMPAQTQKKSGSGGSAHG